jgi:hypothetical protein
VKKGSGWTCSYKCRGKRIAKTKAEQNEGMTMGYAGVHAWIKRIAGQPNYCEFCKSTSGTFDWSNKSGQYLREITDWQRLCRKCHSAFDGAPAKRKETMMARYGHVNPREFYV